MKKFLLSFLEQKKEFFNNFIGYSIGIYFVFLCVIYFFASQTSLLSNQFVSISIKGVLFASFLFLNILFIILNRIRINRFLFFAIIIIFIGSLISILFYPSTQNVFSIARIKFNSDFYNGWAYNTGEYELKISIIDRLIGVFDALTFCGSVFIFTVSLPVILKNRKYRIKSLFIISTFIVLTVLYSCYFERYLIINSFKNTVYEVEIRSIFDNKNTFGLICFSGVVVSFYLFCIGEKKLFKALAMFYVLMCSLGVLFSTCKTALIVLLISIVIFFVILAFSKKRFERNFSLISIALVIVLCATILIFPQLSSFKNKLISLFVDYGSTTIRARLEAWRTVFQTVNGPFIIFGLGDNIYSIVFPSMTEAIRYWKVIPYHSAHNAFFEVYLSGGILRLFLYTLLIIFVFKIILYNKTERVYLLPCFCSVLLYSMFESVILGGQTSMNFVLSLMCLSVPLSLNEYPKNKCFELEHLSKSRLFYLVIDSSLNACFITSAITFGYSLYYFNFLFLSISSFICIACMLGILFHVRFLKKYENDLCLIKTRESISLLIGMLISYLFLFIFWRFGKTHFYQGYAFSYVTAEFDIISNVHYVGGFLPFISLFAWLFILYSVKKRLLLKHIIYEVNI